MIIGINGISKSGKDTVASMLIYLTWVSKIDIKFGSYAGWDEILNQGPASDVELMGKFSGWENKKFGYKLKAFIANILGVPHDVMESREFKSQPMGPEWGGMSGVAAQIAVGDGLRRVWHTDVWVNGLMIDYVPNKHITDRIVYPNWIVTDLRYPNEKEIVQKHGISIRIDRAGITSSFPTDHFLDDYVFDYYIKNDGTLKELFEEVKWIYNDFNFKLVRSEQA